VGGTSSVTDIGTSGVGTTFTGSMSLFVLALAAAAIFALAGAFSLRRREQRG
jgi:LPXTG-motif cell wall-anchored protein